MDNDQRGEASGPDPREHALLATLSAPSHAPSPFERWAPRDVRRLIEAYPLAWVAAADGGAESLLPLVGVFDEQDRLTGLVGHFALANALSAALEAEGRAKILFTGPQGYVSPSHAGRRDWGPTWNYAQVRIQADIEVDAGFTAEAVDILIEHMECGSGQPWRAAELGARYVPLMSHIVGFRARVTALTARFKLGQDEGLDTLETILSNLPAGDLKQWMRDFNSGRWPASAPADE